MTTPSSQKTALLPVGQTPVVRLTSGDLLLQARAVEIEHDGRIYQLRLTRLNKLILTA